MTKENKIEIIKELINLEREKFIANPNIKTFTIMDSNIDKLERLIDKIKILDYEIKKTKQLLEKNKLIKKLKEGLINE